MFFFTCFLHKESELHSNFSITGLGMSDALCMEEKCDCLFLMLPILCIHSANNH